MDSLKMAATYSPTMRSTIGVAELRAPLRCPLTLCSAALPASVASAPRTLLSNHVTSLQRIHVISMNPRQYNDPTSLRCPIFIQANTDLYKK